MSQLNRSLHASQSRSPTTDCAHAALVADEPFLAVCFMELDASMSRILTTSSPRVRTSSTPMLGLMLMSSSNADTVPVMPIELTEGKYATAMIDEAGLDFE